MLFVLLFAPKAEEGDKLLLMKLLKEATENPVPAEVADEKVLLAPEKLDPAAPLNALSKELIEL